MSAYIIMDLEWNQCPRGKEYSIEKLPGEIIEIGAVKLDDQLRIISKYHQLVRPQVYTRMHYQTKKVTHLDVKELQRLGEIFPKAVKQFLAWCGKDCRFCTWGSADLLELQRNMAYYKIKDSLAFPLYYYDIQKLYALHTGDDKSRPALEHVVTALGISENGPFHRALDDAYYTCRVMQAIDFEKWKEYVSVDYFHVPGTKGEEISLEFPTYSKFVSRVFPSKTDALEDRQLTSIVCRECGRRLRKKVKWFSLNQKQYFCLAICPEHGYFQGKLRMKKADGESVFVVKTVKPATEERVQWIMEKKKEQSQKRQKFLRKLRKK